MARFKRPTVQGMADVTTPFAGKMVQFLGAGGIFENVAFSKNRTPSLVYEGSMGPLHQRFDEVLSKAMKERLQRQDFLPDPHDTHANPAWVLFERQTMHDAVNAERKARGLEPVPITEVVRVERCASGHIDYQRKFVLYCAELATGEWRGA